MTASQSSVPRWLRLPLGRLLLTCPAAVLLSGVLVQLTITRPVLAEPTNDLLTDVKLVGRCHPIEVTWYSPTGVAGCSVYGEGYASWWQGPGVARNDCLYPWRNCTPIRITSLATGLTISLRPTMFCDCYTGTARERLVDLPPSALRALGLDPADGLFPVLVEPLQSQGTVPDTAMR